MKAHLEFDLPEDQAAFDAAARANEAWDALHEIDVGLRNALKHGLPHQQTWPQMAEQLRVIIAETRPPE